MQLGNVAQEMKGEEICYEGSKVDESPTDRLRGAVAAVAGGLRKGEPDHQGRLEGLHRAIHNWGDVCSAARGRGLQGGTQAQSGRNPGVARRHHHRPDRYLSRVYRNGSAHGVEAARQRRPAGSLRYRLQGVWGAVRFGMAGTISDEQHAGAGHDRGRLRAIRDHDHLRHGRSGWPTDDDRPARVRGARGRAPGTQASLRRFSVEAIYPCGSGPEVSGVGGRRC